MIEPVKISRNFLLENVGDALHLFFSPLTGTMRLIVRIMTKRTYRVSYVAQEAASMTRTTERFSAYHDREACRMATIIAQRNDFTLEEVRKIRTR